MLRKPNTEGKILKRKIVISLLVISSVVGIAGCNSMPEKPSFRPSSSFDGTYRGMRIDVSNDSLCRETSINGAVENGEAKFKLTYNGTNLTGWVDEGGNLKLYDDNNRWNYNFSGVASGGKIEGEWSVDGAPCRGSWVVERQ